MSAEKSIYRKLPKGIWVLGFVSMFMDISSELVHSLLPVFMVTVLGASMLAIGIVEGLAEGVAAITKVFSGALSDYFRKRKFLTVFGYALSALSKPMFPLATTIGWVFGASFIDRIGKGIRGAPRDALVADIAPVELRGAAYGLRQSLDSVGAFIGPLLAVLLMLWFANDIKVVLWVAVLPAFLAVLLLMVAVREPEPKPVIATSSSRLTLADYKLLSSPYWRVVAFGVVFTLARFSEAFLLLRAQDAGLVIAYVPVVLMVMNIIYALFAYPVGAVSDKFSARTLLLLGLGFLMIADIFLALATSLWLVFAGAALWGLHMAFSQGLLAKLIADNSPQELRASAFGIFHLLSGLTLFLASAIAGLLWSSLGAPATFIAGAVFTLLAIMGLLVYRPAQ